MLVLAARHQQIDPADRRALDRDDHVARRRGAGDRHRLERRAVDRVERIAGELGDHDASGVHLGDRITAAMIAGTTTSAASTHVISPISDARPKPRIARLSLASSDA